MGHYDDEPEWYLKSNWISTGVSRDRNKLWKKFQRTIGRENNIVAEYKKLAALQKEVNKQKAIVERIEHQLHVKISKAVDKAIKEEYGSEEAHRKIHEQSWKDR